MYFSGYMATVFAYGKYAPIIYLSASVIISFVVKGLGSFLATIRIYLRTPQEIIPHKKNRTTQRNTWQDRSKEIHQMITDGRINSEMVMGWCQVTRCAVLWASLT
jgi:hypothetical protein